MSYELQLLGKYIDIVSGYAFKSKDFITTGIPIIKIKNITPPEVSLDDLSYIPAEIANSLSKFELSHGDVLIALTGSHINQMASVVGRVAKVKYNTRSMLNQRVGKIVVKDKDACDLDYVYYYLSQNQVKITLARKAGGAANQANISPADVKGLEIPLPSIETQRRIASILSSYDNLIENSQKQIKLLEEAALRLYKEWFVNLRFLGHENKTVVDGVPEGWKFGVLSDIASFQRGKTITKEMTEKGTIPVVAGGIEPAYYHSKANTSSPLITISASGANAGFTRMYYEDVWASDCSVLDSSGTDILYFIYAFLINSTEQIKNLQRGAAQPHVYAKDINALQLLIPTDKLINEYCSLVSAYFNKIACLNKTVKYAIDARDKLLPKLMNGEIEV